MGKVFEGTVETPETPQQPNNYIIKQAESISDLEELDKLIEHARMHGYSAEGQTMRSLVTKRAELQRGKRR